MAIDKIREMAVELIGRDVVEDVELDEGRKRGYEKSPYEVHTFRLSMGDKKQELLMALLQRGGKKGTPSKGKINDFVYRIPAVDAKKFPGLYAYRYTDKWQNFGPGSMEGIEYMIVSKGTRGKSSGVSVVKYKGSYTVYTPHGQTEVPVKGEVRINKELTADAIVDAIGDDIQYVVDDYMDKNSDVFPEDVELDEGSGALPSESELLSYLKGGKKISVAELAYSFGITPQKATKFVRSLVAKGTLATVKPSEGRVRTSREAVYTLAEDVYLDEANTLPGREKAVSLLTGKASDIERELRTVPWMTKLKPGAFKTLVKESLRDPLVFAVLKTRDDGEYLNKLKTLRSVRGGKTATRIETMIKLAKDKFMNESSKGSTGYSVRKLFDLLLRAVSESNMKMIEMWKKELEDKGADRHAIDLVIRNEKLPAIVKRMKEDVELDEEKRTGKDALANVEMNDFPYSLIVRAVKKKKEWDHDDLKLDLFDVIRAQYYKKYKPHFGKGASDQRLRYVADQFIMRLQRDGKLDHVGMRARDGGVEKTGYGQFVYAVEDVELDEASGSKLAMLKLEWAKLGTKALKAFPSSPVQKEIEEKQRDVENKIDKIQGKGGSYYPETWFKEDVELDEAIPQSEIKNGEVYRKRSNVDPGAGASKYGLDSSNLIGWFANKYNMSVGWTIFDTTPSEKSEFGKDALRTYSEKTKTTSIAKFNLKKGTYAFLDNKAYEDGEIKYDRLSAYNRVRVVDTPKAFKAFGLSKSNVEDVELDEVSGVRSMRDELLHEGGRQTMDDKEFNELGEGVTDKMHQPYVDWMNSSKAKKTAEDAARAAGFSISKSKMKFRLVASSQRGAVLAVSEWREGDKFIRITLGYHPMSGDHTVTVMVGTYDKNKSSFTSTSVRKAELDLSKATLTYKKEVKEDVDLNEGFNYIKDELSKLNSGTTLFDVQITDQLGNKTKVMTLDKELIVGVDKLLGGKKLGKSYRESEIGKLDKESDFLNIKITDYEGKSTKWLKLDKKSWKYISKLKLYKSEDVGMPLSNEVLESVRNIRNTLLG